MFSDPLASFNSAFKDPFSSSSEAMVLLSASIRILISDIWGILKKFFN